MKKISGTKKNGLLALLCCALLLASCARTASVRYYQLTAQEVAATAPSPSRIEATKTVIGIGPVRLPEYLDRPQIVTRQTANRLELADSHRWAEPLSENIPRVLGENLSALLGAGHILFLPSASRPADYQLLVEVLHFENESDRAANLVVRWSVKGQDGKFVLPERRSSYRIPAASHDLEGQVAALNQALGSLCREIAEALRPVLGNL